MTNWLKDQIVTTKIPAVHAAAHGRIAPPVYFTRQVIGDVHRDFTVVHDEVIDAHYLYHLPTGYRLGIGHSEIEAHTAVSCLYALPIKWSTSVPLSDVDADTLEEIRELVGLRGYEFGMSIGGGGLSAFGGPEPEDKRLSDYILDEIEADDRERRGKERKRLKRLG